MNVNDIEITKIGLSVRSINCLRRAGVHTVGEMLSYTEEMLSKIWSMGRKSVDEVLQKIDEYKRYAAEGKLSGSETEGGVKSVPDVPEVFYAFSETKEGREYILSWLKQAGYKTSALELLSARAYNQLLLNGYTELWQIAFKTVGELLQLPRMDLQSAEEIRRSCGQFLKDKAEDIRASLQAEHDDDASKQSNEDGIRDLLQNKEYRDRILEFVRANDAKVDSLNLSVRSKNCLKSYGCFRISEFIFLSNTELWRIHRMGEKSVTEITSFIEDYLAKNEQRIRALLNGDPGALWSENNIRGMILETFDKIGFGGLSLYELREKASIPEQVTDEILKKVLGHLVAEGELEYVDFRCYRRYPRFLDYIAECTAIDGRSKDVIRRRIQDETLESIGSSYNLTRERVRQIVSSSVKKAKNQYAADTGMTWFDEDYFKYFFETYDFDRKDAEAWLGLDRGIFNYLELCGLRRGKKSLDEALDDSHNLDLGLRLKIKNYLNRNKLYLDGRWIEKSRAKLEEFVVRKYCRENVSYDDFIQIYNDVLRKEEVPYDEDIYYTDAVKRTRENKLSADRFLLWKQNRMLRYYDIDSQDYTELLETLNLDAYENIEYSTWKFMRDYPAIMEKYDIRDQYELHNLLRKIVKDGAYHDFHCRRTPMIVFGTFDMTAALLELMMDNAPISQTDFAELVHQEYGYDPATVMGSYLQPLAPYYHQGMYKIDQKVMSADHQNALMESLTDDFYYIEEIRKIYASVVPGADLEEINPYNLKAMGFSVLSNYVYRNHSSLDAYFRHILTVDDITDITAYRSRFAYIVSFSGAVVGMKKEWEIFEFEPNQIITFRKLAAAGVTKEDLTAFCDEVADFVEDGSYFSVKSIKLEGFESELFDLGFSDWFYASLLTTDDRFSFTRTFGSIILYKGDERITSQSFEYELVTKHGSVDVYDLVTEMEETYGCQISERLDLVYKLAGTDVYYDKYLDRLYANMGIFNRELDATEGL